VLVSRLKIHHAVCIPMMPMYRIDANYKVAVEMECVTQMKVMIHVAKIVVDALYHQNVVTDRVNLEKIV
jgi:hypothetical protein